MAEDMFSRRAFLKRSAVAAAAFTILPHARVMGANDEIRMAIIGLGIKGPQHTRVFKEMPGVRVVALCDVDSERIQKVLDKHFSGEGPKPKTYTDVRKLLEDKDIDAVCIAAPNHWHALMTVWACQAGKDVYVEKPATHDIWEGQQMLAAAKKYNRIVQVGTQSRSDPGLHAALQYIKEGNIGELEYLRGIYYNLRQPIGKVSGPQKPPASVDYNLFLGPAPEAPLMREKLHYDWHWQWPYGNGELGNNGVHLLDISVWFLGLDKFPERVMSLGGRFLFDDDGVTPNTHIAYYDYKPVPVLCEIRNLPRSKGEKSSDNLSGHQTGVQVKGKDGYYLGYATGGWVYDNKGKRVKQFPGEGGGSHQQNFIDAVRSRKADSLAADLNKGHLSAGLCHLGNISHRLGEPATTRKLTSAIEDHPVLAESVARFNEHLLVNGVDITNTPRQLGPWLEFDPAAQHFTGELADKANVHLKREYRKGFEIPDQV